MTRLQLSRQQEACSRRASTPTAMALAQDVQGSDTSPGCESGRHGCWHPTEEASQGNTSILSNLLCIMFLFPPAAASFSIPPLPKRNSTPLLLRCTFGHSIRFLQSPYRLCFTGTTIQQPSISRVFVQTLAPGNIQETQDCCIDTSIDLQVYNRKK